MMQPENIWNAVLGELQLQISKSNFDTWLKDSKGSEFSGDLFVVMVPSAFVAETLKSRLNSIICRTLAGIVGQPVQIEYCIQPKPDKCAASSCRLMADGGVSLKNAKPAGKSIWLNPRFTFDNFICTDCNRLPCISAIEIAENPGILFNPLFIYGGTGTGKTHLLQAIGHAVQKTSHSILYMSAEQFANEFISSIKNKKPEEFRYKFTDISILLLDDIQFLSSKTQTQECVFHIINDFLSDNRQVVITSDRPPREISSLNLRLRSRLEGGLLADIGTPDHSTRVKIIEHKAKILNFQLTPSVNDFIATHFHRNVSEIEGALLRLVTYSRLNNTELDINSAKQILSDLIQVSRQADVRHQPNAIIKAVADYYAISPEDITSKKRDLKTSKARHIAMYLLRQQNHCNLSDIGEALGGRDHSTVIYGCEKISAEINTNPSMIKILDDIKKLLTSPSGN